MCSGEIFIDQYGCSVEDLVLPYLVPVSGVIQFEVTWVRIKAS